MKEWKEATCESFYQVLKYITVKTKEVDWKVVLSWVQVLDS